MGDTASDTQHQGVHLLELLYDFQAAHPGLMPALSTLLKAEVDDDADALWRPVLYRLRDDLLIDLIENHAPGVLICDLTELGRIEVEDIKGLRANRLA